MKKIVKYLKDNMQDRYIVVKDIDKNEYYLLIQTRGQKIAYKLEVKGLNNINTFIKNNRLEVDLDGRKNRLNTGKNN